MQDYLREQPDNIKTINLVSEVCIFLSSFYIDVTKGNIVLITQVLKTMIEMSVVCVTSICIVVYGLVWMIHHFIREFYIVGQHALLFPPSPPPSHKHTHTHHTTLRHLKIYAPKIVELSLTLLSVDLMNWCISYVVAMHGKPVSYFHWNTQ